MALSSGTRLGPYEILSPLGAGGMGEVYRARDSKLGRDVAIKVVREPFAKDAERMARFQREARVLASLNHPNIASIYGLEDSGSAPALVMELVEGPTLADRVRQGPIPIDEAVRIARQIAEGMEYAHERGIIHRDLKPANVKVTADDAVKILDFGLAKALAGDAASVDPSASPTVSQMATVAGVMLGTAAYMSPEQAKGKPVDRRADIWAFGCVLYEILAGKVAFHGETVTDILAAVIRTEPDWSQLPANTPTRARALLQRCLQKDPRQRLQAIGDARIALDEVFSDATEPSAVAAQPLWRRTLPWALLGAVVLAFAMFWVNARTAHTSVPASPAYLQISLPAKPHLGLTGLLALSPDGRQLAFVATSADGVRRVWLRALSSPNIQVLPGTESVSTLLFWSPDSRFIAFDSSGKLKKVDLSGGPAEVVCALNKTGVGGSWNRDGVIIFGQFGGPLMQVSASGGVATPLTALDVSHGDVAHTVPWFLPDGRHFLYLRDTGTNGTISVGSLEAKPTEQDARRLVQASYGMSYIPAPDGASGHLLFLRDHTLMAQRFDPRHLSLVGDPVRVVEEPIEAFLDSGVFSGASAGTLVYWPRGNPESQLTWFDTHGKGLGTVGEPGQYAGFALSPDGAQAALSKSTPPDQLSALWLLEMSRGTSTRFALDPSAENAAPVWAPDGRSVIFASAHPGQMAELCRMPSNGGGSAEVLTQSDEWKVPLSLSPDGRFLLYVSVGGATKSDLWLLPLGDHQKPVPFLRTEFEEGDGRFSPDGHWIAYESDESGRVEVYVRPFLPNALGEGVSAMGNKRLISNGGGSGARWRKDGRVLYYVGLDGTLMAVDVSAGAVFQAGVPRALFHPPPSVQWEPSADGKRFLFLVTEPRGQTPFTVLLNWQAALGN